MSSSFDIKRELAERTSRDWQFGAKSEPGIVSIPVAERDAYLPAGELQFDSKCDFEDCSSRASVNYLEALLTYHYAHEMKPDNKKWLDDNGYTTDGKVILSDRFISVLSGTTVNGNSLKAPIETIRTCGLIPKKLLPKDDSMDWSAYYDKTAAYNPKLVALGKEFLKRFPINYEQVANSQFQQALPTEMLTVAAYAWPTPVNGVYPRVDGGVFNHAFLMYNLPAYLIFDNYYDNGNPVFGKKLAPDYIFFEYGYRVYISAENIVVPPPHLFLKNLGFQMTDPEVTYLQVALRGLGYPIPDAPTSIYGTETKAAIAAFQKDHSIVDNGEHFGPRTRLALNAAVNPTQPFGGSFTTLIQSFFSAV